MTTTEPALFRHCVAVYEAMLADAQDESSGYDGSMMVWRGHGTKLVADLDVPGGYYAKIMDCLKQMGSIQQLRRGGGRPPSPSEWLIIQRPDFEVFDTARRPKTQESTIVLTQRVKDLSSRVTLLEGKLNRLERYINESKEETK